MSEQIVEDFFSHHGVKGQRWGVRNSGKIGKSIKYAHETPAQTRDRKLRNAKRIRNGVSIAVGAAYVAAFLASNRVNTKVKKLGINTQRDLDRYNRTVNDMLKPKELGPKLNINFKPQSLNRGPFYNYKPHPNARKILMDQERQRNGAFQAQQMLKKMGNNRL